MREDGFSLVELIIAIAIMAILLALATHNWNEMQTKSAVESQIQMIHADLNEFRLLALHSKTARSVTLSGQVYKEFASTDTSVAPVVTKQLRYPIVWGGSGALTFDAQGLTTNLGSLCVLPTNDITVINTAAIDSIVVSNARINLGKRTGGSCTSAFITPK